MALTVVAAGALVWFLSRCLAHALAGERPVLHLISFAVLATLPTFHLVLAWWLTLIFRPRTPPEPDAGSSVDVFVTVTDEPDWLVERTLRAAIAITHPHRTWLLEDGGERRFESLAGDLGAEYLARPDTADCKAGNINYALGRTDGDYVAIFDVDHTPTADFLDRTLGFFRDPTVGFVQAMVTFSNPKESVFARASAQTAFEYYNIVAVGKDRLGAAGLMGTNAVIRRRALEDIGGYRAGLAEDLATSLAIHGAGWRSAYVREPLAPGLAPADFTAFSKQQIKWASGVFEAALASFRGDFRRLSMPQRLCYLVRFTYYLLPVLFAFNLALFAFQLVFPVMDLERPLLDAAPLVVACLALRAVVFRTWALEPEARRGVFIHGSSLVVSAWPMYVAAAVLSAVRRPLSFIATPKLRARGLSPRLYLPQLAVQAALLFGLIWRAKHWDECDMPVTWGFGALLLLSQWMLWLALGDSLGRRTSDDSSSARSEHGSNVAA